MSKRQSPYAPEFRRQIVDMVRSGWTPEELSREFEPTPQAIWSWVHCAKRESLRADGRLPDLGEAGRTRPRREVEPRP